MRYVRPLSAIRLTDSGAVGSKAAVLGELSGAGFAVPAGFAIVAAAFQDARPHGDDEGGDAEPAAGSSLPRELMAELRLALADLGDGPVAVRSSAAEEDGAGASFAGQYESVLNVEGLGALTAAVRRCWASSRSSRIAVYRGGRAPAGPIGLLVQRMVPADAAGAAFSVNPVTGDPGETLVSAVPGLADQLMAGTVTPDEWVVRGGDAQLRSGAHHALQEKQVRSIAQLTCRVAAHLGAPQDVEWAIAGPAVWLIQARPITALPTPPPEARPLEIAVPPGFWARGPGSDRPWTPLQRSVYLPVLAQHLGGMFAFSLLGPPRVREIGGWFYVSIGAAGGQPELTARARRIGAAAIAGEPQLLLRRWHAEWKPAFASRIAELRDVVLAAVADDELIAHVGALTGLFTELHDVYFRLTGASSFTLGGLGLACQELLGWTAGQTMRLRGGLRGAHVAAVAGLAELARQAAGRPAVQAALERADGGTADDVAGLDDEFAAMFRDYRRAYAHRTGGFDLTEPTLDEQPHVLLSLVRAQLEHPFDLDAERAALDGRVGAVIEEAESLLAERPAGERDRFAAAVAASHASTEVRDEKVFYAVCAWALVRYAALEIGSRLTERGQVTRADDVFFLERDEALGALRTGAAQRELVRQRRAEHAWARLHPGPPTYGTPAADAAPMQDILRSLPPEARTAVEASLWTTRLWGGAPPAQASGDGVLRGTAASAGRYTGPVRLITGVHEFGKIRRGDVLVCPETTAQWAVLFPSIGALAADKGGLLSHPAIIAREYGVPAVVATGTATRLLRDGQIVTVDGTEGTVRYARGGLA